LSGVSRTCAHACAATAWREPAGGCVRSGVVVATSRRMRWLSRTTPLLLSSLVFIDLGLGSACTSQRLSVGTVQATGTLSYSEEGSVKFSTQSFDPFLSTPEDATYTIDASYDGTYCQETMTMTFDQPSSAGVYDLATLHAQVCMMDLQALRALDFCNGTGPYDGTTGQETCIPVDGKVSFTELSPICAGGSCMMAMVADLEMTAPSAAAKEAITGSIHIEISPEVTEASNNSNGNHGCSGAGVMNWAGGD
jgi:hypothetical protein